MNFIKFSMSIITPIKYDKTVLDKELEEQELKTLCKQSTIKGDWWSEKGRKLFCEDSKIVKSYELLQENSVRSKLGLYQNRTAWYRLKNKKAPKVLFQINTMKLWICENEIGFLEINIITNRIDIEDICTLQGFLVKKFNRKDETKIEYIGNEKLLKNSIADFSIKELLQKICRNDTLKRSAGILEYERTYRDLWTMSYILTEQEWKDQEGITECFQKICDERHYYMPIEKSGNNIHWGISGNHIVLIANGKNKYADIGPNGEGGLYRSVYHEYMTLYTYMISKKITIENGTTEDENSVFKRWKTYQKFSEKLCAHDHVNEIFNCYFLRCLDLDNIENAKIPVRQNADQRSYLFISYSHEDYRKVYPDLVELYEKGVCYWYDQGLEEHAGESWKMEVHRHITNPNCIGVIFYMSEQLFLSSSIFEEIEIVCGISNKNLLPKSFFAVNLSDKGVPILVLKNALNRKTDNELKTGDFMKRIHVLSGAFLDENTALSYHADKHVEKIYHVIQKQYPSAIIDYNAVEGYGK